MASVDEALAAANEHYRTGRMEQAAAIYRQVVAADAQQADAWHYLGAIAYQSGSLDEATRCVEQALHVQPRFAEAQNTLGLIRQASSDLEGAAGCFREAIAQRTDFAAAHYNWGRVLSVQGAVAEAAACYGRALELRPDYVEAHNNLGVAFQELGRLEEAVASLRRAIALQPDYLEAQHNLAIALMMLGRLSEATQLVEALLLVNAADADAWSVKGLLAQRRGDAAGALVALERALAIRPQPNVASDVLLTMQYVEDVWPERLLTAHREWDARFAASIRGSLGAPLVPAGQGERPVQRIGFLSKDFRQHPVVFLALPLIEQLHHLGSAVVGYCDSHIEDAYTRRVRASCKHWHQTRGWTDEALARQIAADKLDVLVDLMGHTGERMLVFARRPAPVQATWAGYVGTTGVAEMDFLLADRVHVRPGEEDFYSEKILRMPGGYVCYQPPADALEVGPLPALASGRFTFGCFNNPVKYSPRLLDAWAEILRQTPGSRLLLKFGALDDLAVADRLRAEFKQRGVEWNRLLLEGFSPHAEFLAAYGRVDLALDTQPYSGGVTTCEALWMGVPVVTYPGRTFAGRHAASHLSAAGYSQFIADDLEGYVRLAVEWSGRVTELAELRQGMRERMRASGLCDAARFAREFMSVVQGTLH